MHDHAHHHHDHVHAQSRPPGAGFGRAFALGTMLNAGFVAAEVVFGIAAHSMALLADAVHNAGDALALLLAWGRRRWRGGCPPCGGPMAGAAAPSSPR